MLSVSPNKVGVRLVERKDQVWACEQVVLGGLEEKKICVAFFWRDLALCE